MAEGGTSRFGVRARVLAPFALIAVVDLGLTIAAMVVVADEAPEATAQAMALWQGGAAMISLGVIVWVWLMFDERLARPVERIGRGAFAAAHGGARELDLRGSQHLGALGPGAAAAAAALARARDDTAAAVQAATAEADRRRRQLETVLRDLDQAVMVCTADNRVLLYNRRAQQTLGGCGELGLGRPLFDLIVAQPIEHVLETLRRRLDDGRSRDRGLSAPFVAATSDGARTLQGRVTLMPDANGGEPPGFVVSFDDVTGAHLERLDRDRLVRRGLAAASEALDAAEAGESGLDAARQALARFGSEAREQSAASWPMSEVFSLTLWTSIIRRRTGPQNFSAEIVGEPQWLRCDSVAVVEMLDVLLNRIADGLGVRAFALGVEPDVAAGEERVRLTIRWRGPRPSERLMADWAGSRLDAAIGGVTPQELMTLHGAAPTLSEDADGWTTLGVSLPGAWEVHAAPAPPPPARPEFYDFDLLDRAVATDVCESASLRQLAYVVFDTETTGLEPSRGDRIVQVAGVRIVNGRVLRGEAFDSLINPGRRIPAASTRIHRIDDAMVADAPSAREALTRFHGFAAGAVLVAHNAAFDLRFLEVEARETGAPRFDQPALDTVLLAARLHGQDGDLTLDALARRFAVDLPAERRHTALGDAMATAEVFLRLLDMLEAEGVRTLGEALEASRGPAAIRRAQAAY